MLCPNCSKLVILNTKKKCVKCQSLVFQNIAVLCESCSRNENICAVCMRKIYNLFNHPVKKGCRSCGKK